MEWIATGESVRMTTWVKDKPPSGTTSSRVGCAKADIATVGDTTDCDQVCDQPPSITINVEGDLIINQGGFNG